MGEIVRFMGIFSVTAIESIVLDDLLQFMDDFSTALFERMMTALKKDGEGLREK